jgi:hypothetical protein
MGSESEAEVKFYIHEVVVVLAVCEVAVVHVRIFSVNLQILGEVVVQTALYLVH